MNVQTKPVKQGKTAIRDAIEQDIVTAFYAPGERLDEARLAARHSVSRTPVREALIQLSTMGLVKIVPNRGAFVSQLSVTEIVERFEVMGELEAMCARLAARRILPGQFERLVHAQESCEAAGTKGNSDDYYYANEQFHQLIYEASGNAFLADQANTLQRRLKPYRRLQLRVPGRVGRSLSEHMAILDAIRAHDPVKAHEAMRGHIVIQGDFFSDFLAAMSPVETRLQVVES